MGRESGLIPLIPFPCLPVGGPGTSKRGNAFLKATAICKANQVESLKLLEISFKRKRKKKGKLSCVVVQVGSSRRAASGSVNRKWQEMDQPAEAGWWTPLQQFMPPATLLQCQGSHLPKSFLTPAFARLKALVQGQAGLPSMANHCKF